MTGCVWSHCCFVEIRTFWKSLRESALQLMNKGSINLNISPKNTSLNSPHVKVCKMTTSLLESLLKFCEFFLLTLQFIIRRLSSVRTFVVCKQSIKLWTTATFANQTSRKHHREAWADLLPSTTTYYIETYYTSDTSTPRSSYIPNKKY